MIGRLQKRMAVILVAACALAIATAAHAQVTVDKGGTGDYLTIQGAVNAVAPGTQINVIDTTGTGYTETVEVNKNNLSITAAPGVTITGTGTTFSFDGLRSGAIAVDPGVTGTTIQGFNFIGGSNSNDYGVYVATGANNTTVKENTFNGDFSAAVGSANGAVSGLTINRNTVQDYGFDGFQIGSGATNLAITENTIFNSTNDSTRSNIYINSADANNHINLNNILGLSLTSPGVLALNGFGLFLDGTAVADIDATLNWWNSIGGPRPISTGASLFASNADPLASELFFSGPVSFSVFLDPALSGPYDVPEPASLALLGLGALAFIRRRRIA